MDIALLVSTNTSSKLAGATSDPQEYYVMARIDVPPRHDAIVRRAYLCVGQQCVDAIQVRLGDSLSGRGRAFIGLGAFHVGLTLA